jgi:hypothetical protein
MVYNDSEISSREKQAQLSIISIKLVIYREIIRRDIVLRAVIYKMKRRGPRTDSCEIP